VPDNGPEKPGERTRISCTGRKEDVCVVAELQCRELESSRAHPLVTNIYSCSSTIVFSALVDPGLPQLTSHFIESNIYPDQGRYLDPGIWKLGQLSTSHVHLTLFTIVLLKNFDDQQAAS
jgi:hypothetical protein